MVTDRQIQSHVFFEIFQLQLYPFKAAIFFYPISSSVPRNYLNKQIPKAMKVWI
ncbi:hypothetical protein C1645_770042 [Glomus cerebriforme]|uniref:Uncharacterized protein n=1 Tax=Glomus cerebriforme TaxID=658196 RepID=A0A397T0F6_9GLOM|nr:hypothetical protein C1645_791605 [Glomus cerebriforme]RIA90376.1 hypothetical protein C1645_770042 [Glomus cerebriforme]